MSTGLNCSFYRIDGRWFYLLEHETAPRGADDWREYATAYGPFASEELAEQHLDENHANPGGWSTHEDPIVDIVLAVALAHSVDPRKAHRTSGWR